MAGVLKARDTSGVLRNITDVKVRDVGGTLRTLSFIKVRGPDGVLREVFTAGGGDYNPAYINPGVLDIAGTIAHQSAYFEALSTGDTPTSYSWGVASGPAVISAGGSTSMATITITVGTVGAIGDASIYCDMVIGGVTYRAYAEFIYLRTSDEFIP